MTDRTHATDDAPDELTDAEVTALEAAIRQFSAEHGAIAVEAVAALAKAQVHGTISQQRHDELLPLVDRCEWAALLDAVTNP